MADLNMRPPSNPPDGLNGLTREDIIEEIKAWFFANFEDPAESTPYITREGGYQYIWGGPYDAQEEIEQYFGGIISEDIIEDVVKEIEHYGVEWAPNQGRIYEEYEDEGNYETGLDVTQVANDAYENLLRRVNELEVMLSSIPKTPRGIGDNNPPEDIGLPPYNDEDERSIIEAISVLRRQKAWSSDESEAVEEAGKRLENIGTRLKNYLVNQADKAFTGFMGSFSDELGKWTARGVVGVTGVTMFGAFADKLIQVAQAVQTWLQSIQLPF